MPTPGLITISPSSGRPGQKVTLTLDGACFYGLTFSSTVLTVDEVYPYPARGDATVKPEAKPGTYDVLADCYGNGHPPKHSPHAARFTVVQSPLPAGHQVTKVPTGAAQTGGGGTAPQS